MSEEFLNRAEVIAIFQEVRGKQVPPRVAAGRLGQPYVSCRLCDGPLPHAPNRFHRAAGVKTRAGRLYLLGPALCKEGPVSSFNTTLPPLFDKIRVIAQPGSKRETMGESAFWIA